MPLNSRTKSYLDLAAKLSLLVCIGIRSFTFQFNSIPAVRGLDPSWQFGLNYFCNKGFIFGKDIIWTYGPLGFLDFPMNVGNCMDIALILQLSVWITFLAIITYYSLKNRFSVTQLFLFVALLFIAMNGFSPSTLLYMLVFLLLSLAHVNSRWTYPYILALVCSVLLFFIKVSYTALMLPAFAVFVFSQFFINKKKALYAAAIAAVGFPLLFIACYLIYNPSFSDMLAFLKGSQELSNGYSVAMSDSGTMLELIAAGSVLLCYLYLMYVLYSKKQSSFWISLLLIVPLFWSFKSGFVRQDTGHVAIFFTGSFFFVGLILLFTDLRNTRMKVQAIALCALMLVIWYVGIGYKIETFDVTDNLKNIVLTLNYSGSKESSSPQQGRTGLSLLPAVLKEIGASKVSIFPSEISYAAANNFNYSPFPVPQLYAAYTPYLDLLDARYLEHSPDFMLMDLEDIDYRHPLLDVPATWLAMYKWFDVDLFWVSETQTTSGGQNFSLGGLLLKRRATPRFNDIRPLSGGEYPIDSLIKIPASNHPILIKISMRLNLLGKLAKLFFRVPQVSMQLTTGRGLSDYRVVPDTLSSPMLINALPLNLTDVVNLMDNNTASNEIYAIQLHNTGLKYYQEEMTVVFYQLPEVKIKF